MNIEPQTSREKALLNTVRNSDRRVYDYSYIGASILAVVVLVLFSQYPKGSNMRVFLLMMSIFSAFIALSSFTRLSMLRTFHKIIKRIENGKQNSQQGGPGYPPQGVGSPDP